MLLLLLISTVTGLFNFEYMKVNFKGVEEESILFTFLGKNTSMYLQSRDVIELVLLENESFEIYRSPLTQDVNFVYNNGFFVNGNEMEFSYNEGIIMEPSTTEAFQLCYDFSTDKIIFESAIGFLVLCILALTGKINQDYFKEILSKLRGYIRNEKETQV